MARERLRMIAWTVAVAAPVAALVAAGVERLSARGPRRAEEAPEFRSIRKVPAKPPLWREHPRNVTRLDWDSRSTSPVGVENPHAPPTPALGTPVQRMHGRGA